MTSIFKKYRPILFVISVFVGLSIYYEMPYWLKQKPKSVHVWRQSDCASYALNYYQNNRSFFSPQVHHRHAIDGQTVSEFPIIYYVASQLYKVFGFHDYFIRWINFLILFTTIIVLVQTTGYFVKHWFLRSIPSLLLMVSCVFMYYGSSFLPDAPALCLAVLGFHFFIKDYWNRGKWDFSMSILMSTLAALLKISSGIILGSILVFLILSIIKKTDQVYVKKHFYITFSGLLVVFLWLGYVKIYNEIGQYFGNLQGTMGIWTIQKNEILYIFQRTFQEWMPALISYKIWFFFIPGLIFIMYHWSKLPITLQAFLLTTGGAVVLYLLAFFAVFNVHDYYFINMLIFPVIVSISILHILEKVLEKKSMTVFVILALILFALTAEDARAQFHFRKTDPGWNAIPLQSFYEIEQELRKLGITRHDLVYSPTDPSTNITLYLMNNPGWTQLFGVTAEDAKNRGAKYMVIEKSMLDTETYVSYKSNVIGSFHDLLIIKF